MDISKLFPKGYDKNSSGPFNLEILTQELEINKMLFKNSVKYLAHCIMAYNIETAEGKPHNMLEINYAIICVNRFKSKFFLLLLAEEVINEFFNVVGANAPSIDIKDLNLENITRLSSSPGKQRTLKNGGGRKRNSNRKKMGTAMTIKNSKSAQKTTFFQYLLMLMTILNLVSAGQTEPIETSPVGLFMSVALNDIKKTSTEYAKISVGFQYPMQDGKRVINETVKDEPVTSTLSIGLSDIKRKIWEVMTTPAKEQSIPEVIEATKFKDEFNDISDKIQTKINTLCERLVTEININKIFGKNEISNLEKYEYTSEPVSSAYFSRGNTATEKHVYFNAADMNSYLRKLCTIPELRLETHEKDDGTYTVALTKYGHPQGEELFQNLTIAVNEHLSNLIHKSEKAYSADIKKKGINDIAEDFSLITSHSIRRTYLLNLQEKMSLYKNLLDTEVDNLQKLQDVFIMQEKTNKPSTSDIISPTVLNKFFKTIINKNIEIHTQLEKKLEKEEFVSDTPYNIKELAQTESIVAAQIKSLEQMQIINAGSIERQQELLRQRQQQQQVTRNATASEREAEHNKKKESISYFMNDWMAYAEGVATPLWDTTGKILNTGKGGFENIVKGVGSLTGGTVYAFTSGLFGSMFGEWSSLAGLVIAGSIPSLFFSWLTFKYGGISLLFRLIKGTVMMSWAVVTYLPKQIYIALFARTINGTIVSNGTVIIDNPPQNLSPHQNVAIMPIPLASRHTIMLKSASPIPPVARQATTPVSLVGDYDSEGGRKNNKKRINHRKAYTRKNKKRHARRTKKY